LYVAFAGRDLAQGEMQRWAAQLGVADRALFLGHVDNVQDLLAQCDGMVLLSPSEGCSNAVLQAMSCGATVIVADTGAQELIEHGHSGFCVKTGDMMECVRLMRELHDRPELRARVGQAARQRVLQDFSLEEMARRYQDLYDEVLASPLPPGSVPFTGASPSGSGRRDMSCCGGAEMTPVAVGGESQPSE
jgi:glycosyltransferase involved in cell wall biosynthesis